MGMNISALTPLVSGAATHHPAPLPRSEIAAPSDKIVAQSQSGGADLGADGGAGHGGAAISPNLWASAFAEEDTAAQDITRPEATNAYEEATFSLSRMPSLMERVGLLPEPGDLALQPNSLLPDAQPDPLLRRA